MFSPTVNVDLDLLLDSLGSFYKNLDEDGKTRIKNYWTVLIESVGGLYYDLYQNHLAKLLNYTQGFIENQYQEYKVIFDGDDKNVTEIVYNCPTVSALHNDSYSTDNTQYLYSVTSVTDYGETTPSTSVILISGAETLATNSNYFSWNLVSGISTYSIYGRTEEDFGLLYTISGIPYTENGTYEFTDDGSFTPGVAPPEENTAIWARVFTIPTNLYYMTIPTLSGQSTEQTLYENDDYEIEDLRKIKFIKPISSGIQPDYISYNAKNANYEISEVFIAKQELCLIPSLTSIYWPGLGLDIPSDIVNYNLYYPLLSGLDSETYFNQRQAYTKHLVFWTYGLVNVLREPPTMSNIKKALAFLMGLAFSYITGTVIAIDNDTEYKYITISGTDGQYTYKVSTLLNLQFEQGDSVTKFDILTDGTYATDYIEDLALVSGNTLKEGQITEYDMFTEVYSINDHKFRLYETFGEDILKIKTGDELTRGTT
ncbi:MAG TPA: hypothetical protein PKN48_00430 [Bacteroidales bacterium]|nr:hypothetical protein [Bacteroidales bacterium]